jgi:uncharacterized oxidoreductase
MCQEDSDMNLDGLRVVVTGGGSGIGLAMARLFATTGPVAIVGRDPERLAAAVDATPALRSWVVDITDQQSAAQGISSIAEAFGGIDLVVNNAGVMEGYEAVGDASAERAERDFAINVLGALRITRLAMPYLRRSTEGAVVFISSVTAIAPAPSYAVYSATKAAIHSLARSLRREVRPLKVFEVLPTWVDTAPAEGLGVSKLDPDAVARTVLSGIAADRFEIGVGQARIVSFASRVSPGLAEALVARATR